MDRMADVFAILENGGLLAFAALVYLELRALRRCFHLLASSGPAELRAKLDEIQQDTIVIRETVRSSGGVH
jgi:hypothetical protein